MRIVNYFARKNELAKKAKAHTKEMSLDYSEEIDSAINRSVIYGPEMPKHTDFEKDLSGAMRSVFSDTLPPYYRRPYTDTKDHHYKTGRHIAPMTT